LLKKKEEVRLVGFGTFATANRAATTGRNPESQPSTSEVQGREGPEGRVQ
jgi:nucleoid DNA-binding protein